MTALGSRRHDVKGRSTGMRKTNDRTRIQGQFAPRLIDMLRSPAYRALSRSGHRILARLEIELADHGGTDNGALPCTFADFEAYGMDRHAVSSALREVVALGFVEITEQGRAGNGDYRTPNLFRLTYRDTGNMEPTNEWRRLADGEAVKRALQKAKCDEEAEKATRKKTKDQWGFLPRTGGETPTENALHQCGKPPPVTGISPVGISPTTLDISGAAPAFNAPVLEKPMRSRRSRGAHPDQSAFVFDAFMPSAAAPKPATLSDGAIKATIDARERCFLAVCLAAGPDGITDTDAHRAMCAARLCSAGNSGAARRTRARLLKLQFIAWVPGTSPARHSITQLGRRYDSTDEHAERTPSHETCTALATYKSEKSAPSQS